MKEFKEIMGHPDYLINEDGLIKDKINNRLIIPTKSIIGRPSVIIDGTTYSLDLLVATNFDIEGEGYIIRYKDNDVNNIKKDNLYWYHTEEEEDIDNIIEELKEKQMEMEKNKAYINSRNKSIYIINRQGEIIGEYNGCAELDKKFNKIKYFNSYKTKLKYSPLLGGYIVGKTEWNEEKKQEVIKKAQRGMKYKTTPNDFKELDKAIYLISPQGNIMKEYSSDKELDGVVFFGKTFARQKIFKMNFVGALNGYLCYKRNWNEEYKQRILEKERIRHKPRRPKKEQNKQQKKTKPIEAKKTNTFNRIKNWIKNLFKRNKK